MLWAAATMLYGRAGKVLPPIRLNAIKGVFTTLLFAVTLLALGRPFVSQLQGIPIGDLWLLGVSGIIGIAIGDSFYFAAVNDVGARRVALLSLLATPMVVLLGITLLGERPSMLQLAGMIVTVGGVAWVILERAPLSGKFAHPKHYARGIPFGILAAAGQAVGAVMNREALRDNEGLDPLTSALWRLGVATFCLLPIFLLRSKAPRPRVDAGTWGIVIVAALMGTYGGIWLQQEAFARAAAGPVQTLLSTTPIWILPLAAVAGEKLTPRAVLGAIVAVGGVALVVFG
jgi:drug/metabolite transporter (DMT)-like permease